MNYFNYTDDELMQLRDMLADNLGLSTDDLDNLSVEGAIELAIKHGIIVPDEETMYNIRGSLAEAMGVPMESLESITDEGVVEMAARYGAL